MSAATAPRTLDVSHLPTVAFGARDPAWWGMILLVAIEATMFGLLAATYFYLRGDAIDWTPQGWTGWPPSTMGREVAIPATGALACLLLACIPQHLANRAALRADVARARLWMLLTALVGFAFIAFRGVEIAKIPFRWDAHAYGSVFWMILVLHTVDAGAAAIENAYMTALLFKRPVEERRMADVRVGSIGWYFVTILWVLLYAVLYLEDFFFRQG